MSETNKILDYEGLAIYTEDAKKYIQDQIKNIPQHDWNQEDETASDYIKNKPFYINKDGNVITMDEKFIPDTIVRKSDLEDINLSGYATKESVNELSNNVNNLPRMEISETTPVSENVNLWVKSVEGPEYVVPEVKDNEVSEVDTWSSKKINEEIGKLSNNKSDFSGNYNDLTNKPTIPTTPQQVGADPSGTANSMVSTHNTSETSHNDIRLLIEGLSTRLNILANSDDTTLDQMAEVVAYIKSNRSLIEQVTSNKVNVSDIIDNLTTSSSNKVLSAKQGVALKALIDAIKVPTKTSELTNDSGFLTQHQNISGKADKATTLSGYGITDGATKSELTTHTGNTTVHITSTERTAWNNKSNFSGVYTDLTGKPTIPSKTSQLTNDSGFLTEHQDLSVYAKKATTLDGYGITDGATKEQVNQLSQEIGDLNADVCAFNGNANKVIKELYIPNLNEHSITNVVIYYERAATFAPYVGKYFCSIRCELDGKNSLFFELVHTGYFDTAEEASNKFKDIINAKDGLIVSLKQVISNSSPTEYVDVYAVVNIPDGLRSGVSNAFNVLKTNTINNPNYYNCISSYIMNQKIETEIEKVYKDGYVNEYIRELYFDTLPSDKIVKHLHYAIRQSQLESDAWITFIRIYFTDGTYCNVVNPTNFSTEELANDYAVKNNGKVVEFNTVVFGTNIKVHGYIVLELVGHIETTSLISKTNDDLMDIYQNPTIAMYVVNSKINKLNSVDKEEIVLTYAMDNSIGVDKSFQCQDQFLENSELIKVYSNGLLVNPIMYDKYKQGKIIFKDNVIREVKDIAFEYIRKTRFFDDFSNQLSENYEGFHLLEHGGRSMTSFTPDPSGVDGNVLKLSCSEFDASVGDGTRMRIQLDRTGINCTEFEEEVKMYVPQSLIDSLLRYPEAITWFGIAGCWIPFGADTGTVHGRYSGCAGGINIYKEANGDTLHYNILIRRRELTSTGEEEYVILNNVVSDFVVKGNEWITIKKQIKVGNPSYYRIVVTDSSGTHTLEPLDSNGKPCAYVGVPDPENEKARYGSDVANEIPYRTISISNMMKIYTSKEIAEYVIADIGECSLYFKDYKSFNAKNINAFQIN